MQKTISKYLFLFLIFTFNFQNSYSQDSSEKKNLSTILVNLEKKHNVRFSYATQNITGISILPPTESSSLKESLKYLSRSTPLNFTQINERFITVVLKKRRESLCGKIIDASTGLPLGGATIVTINDSYNTITNAQGVFYLPVTAIDKITIRYLGFEKITMSINLLGKDCSPILLRPIISELEQVVLQNFIIKGIDKHFDGSITLNTNNFGLLPGQVENDVLQIIQVLPGVESVDETISNINIRGGTHDESLILWDDIKMYQNGHFFGLISAFNPDLSHHVTVFKNGTHARYGESVSGVIDMKSKNNRTNSISGGAGFNLINTSAFVSIPITHNFGIQVSGRKSINNILESNVYKTYSERIFQDTEITDPLTTENTIKVSADEEFNFYDFSTKFLWDFSEKDNLRVNFLNIDNTLDFTETIELEESTQSKTSDLRQQSIVGGISWKRDWNDRLESNMLVYGSYYLLNSLNKDIFTAQQQIQENEVLETGFKLDVNVKLSEKIIIQTGYHFSETGIANTQDVNLPRFRSHKKDVLRSHIVFGNLIYSTYDKKTVINGGLRVNYYSKFDVFKIEPRLSIHQKLMHDFAIEVLGEFKSQTTTQRIDFQSDFLGVEKRRWVLVNNDNIPIIKSKQISMGLVYNKNNWFINLEGFYKNVDGITSSNQGFQNQLQFTQTIGSYQVKGLEFILIKKVNSFSAWLSYVYMKNDYEFKIITPSNFPNNIDIRHSTTLAGSYNFNKFKLALGVNWHSGKPYTIPLEGDEIITIGAINSIQYDTPNTKRLSDYFRTNLSAEYLFKISDRIDTKINLAILNVFDRKNTLNIRYALDTDEDGEIRVNQIEEVSLGISPNFSLQVLF